MAMWGTKKEEANDAWQKECDAVRVKKFLPIITLCQTRAQNIANILRSDFARSGRPLSKSGDEVFFDDVFALVINFARASAGMSEEMGDTLFTVGNAHSNGHPISEDMYRGKQNLRGKSQSQFWSWYNKEHASLIEQDPEVFVPLSVQSLAIFDSQNGTDYAREAAQVFLDFASLVCNQADRSHKESLIYVMNEYTRLLTPFIEKVKPPVTENNESAECAECVAAYLVLGLERGASRDDIQAAYRDFAKMYHPDRFPESDQRLRVRAEAEFKKLQQAHNHIIEHSHD